MSVASNVKTILFLATSLAVGIGIGKGYLLWKQHNGHDFTHVGDPPVPTGVGDAPTARGFTVADLSTLPTVLKDADRAFATTIGIEYPPGMTSDALAEATQAVHKHGFTVVLLPPPVFSPGNPYGRPMANVANDAHTAGVEYLCVSWLNAPVDGDFWLNLATNVRGIYKGTLIFAATPPVLTGIDCWEAGDLLAAIGPLPFGQRLPGASDDIKPHDLRVAWDCTLSTLEHLTAAHGKKLALLNANIPSAVTHKYLPADAPPAPPPTNARLQRLLYDALLLETKGRAATTEMILFRSGPSTDASAPASIPGLLPYIAETWDPKKPKPAEPLPPPPPATDETVPESAPRKDDL